MITAADLEQPAWLRTVHTQQHVFDKARPLMCPYFPHPVGSGFYFTSTTWAVSQQHNMTMP